MKLLSRNLLLLVLVLLSGCVSYASLLREADKQNTVEAYEEFLQRLQRNPDADPRFAATARDRIEALQYKQADESGTVRAFWEFLQEYPDGQRAKNARERIMELTAPKTVAEANDEEMRIRNAIQQQFEKDRHKDEATDRHIKAVHDQWSKLYYGMTCEQVDNIIGFVEYQRAIHDSSHSMMMTCDDDGLRMGFEARNSISTDFYKLTFESGRLVDWSIKTKKENLL